MNKQLIAKKFAKKQKDLTKAVDKLLRLIEESTNQNKSVAFSLTADQTQPNQLLVSIDNKETFTATLSTEDLSDIALNYHTYSASEQKRVVGILADDVVTAFQKAATEAETPTKSAATKPVAKKVAPVAEKTVATPAAPSSAALATLTANVEQQKGYYVVAGDAVTTITYEGKNGTQELATISETAVSEFELLKPLNTKRKMKALLPAWIEAYAATALADRK